MTKAARIVGVVDLALLLLGLGLSVAAGNASNVVGGVWFLSFPLVALVIERSRPGSPVTWCYLISGALFGIEKLGDDLTVIGRRDGWSETAVRWAAWCANWTWFPGLFLLITVALLRFPDGRLPSPGWRWVERVSVVAMVGWAVGISAAASSVPVAVLITAVEPLPAAGVARWLFLAREPLFPVLACCAVASVASLVVRQRRSGPLQRAQIRWVLAAAAVAVVVELALSLHAFVVGSTPFWLQDLGEGVGFGLIAVATGVAITRYKLYEIDRIVSRTLAYAVVITVLAAVYVGVLLGIAAVVPAAYGQVGVAAATLTVTVLAVPLTRRVRRAVDHRFQRSRFDAERVVAEFASALRARPDHGDVPTDLLAVVARTVQPSSAGVWVAPSGRQWREGTHGPTPPTFSTV